MQKSVIFYTEGVYYMNKEYDLWNEYGMTQRENNIKLGLYTSYQWKNSRRHLLFTIARYKFAMKMIGNIYEKDEKSILDIGCNDGFGTYFISEYAKKVIGVDFDRDAIDFAIANSESNVIEYKCEDFLNKKYGDFDGVISFDVIEHIYPEHVCDYMKTVLENLKYTGTFVIGTPSLESQLYSKENVKGAHVNVYKGEDFYKMLKQYFYNVYLFTQNDEVIHTGHLQMANYLIAVCSHKREINK